MYTPNRDSLQAETLLILHDPANLKCGKKKEFE
jgi:hypothetical protein